MSGSVQVVYPRCAGLDVHLKTVVACRMSTDSAGKVVRAVKTFRTMTGDLVALSRWLTEGEVTHVAMESTGVYWKPVFNLLENNFHVLLVNAQHIKAVPGRKTDVRDAEWIADLLRHGLLKASFVPERYQRELRELTRYRTTLIRERAGEINRIQKTLEGANIKLGAVISNVVGVSGREMLAALVAGATQDEAPHLAQLARGTMRRKVADLEAALHGRVGAHQRFLLARQLAHIDDLDAVITDLDAELLERLQPDAALVARLDGIPGIGHRGAEVIVAEIGTRLDRFPSADHLTAWAGLAPATHVSGGKRRPTSTRKGDTALRAILVEAALAAGRSRATALGARYRRLAARRGKKKAAVAVARHLLVIIYHLLKDGTTYHEHGPDYLDDRTKERTRDRLVHRLQTMGYAVTVTPLPPPPLQHRPHNHQPSPHPNRLPIVPPPSSSVAYLFSQQSV
jgi:transposase